MKQRASFSEQPLRARKRARTRVALVQALLPQLAERTLDEVPVAELAAAAEVSQATFFNYFPTKADLLAHFIQLWSLRVGAEARRIHAEQASALRAIEGLFRSTAEQTAASPGVMLEIIAFQARLDPAASPEPVELAERLLFLPDEPDVMGLDDMGLGELLPRWIGEAVAGGELPADADVGVLTVAAVSIFFGVPLVVGRSEPSSIAPMYQLQLQLLWAGARSQGSS